jgi:hypothetical protein
VDEQNELDSIFEEELSDGNSDNSIFTNSFNSPLKYLELYDNNHNNNNTTTIIKENSNLDFSSDDSFKKIKRKRVTLNSINEKLRKYAIMKNILLQNDKNAHQVDNSKYPKPTVAQLKKTFTSTSKSSNSYKHEIKLTDSDREYLSKAQINKSL